MADIDFEVTSGPYAGRYGINVGDITASDIGDLIAAGGPDLDVAWLGGGRPGVRVFAGFVWIVKKRGGAKGLAYRAVADTISAANIQDASEESGDTAAGFPDPSRSDADS